MTTDISIKTWKQATNHSPSGDFKVAYLTAEDGRQFTVYENTPGTALITQDAKVTLHYKENVKNGKTFFNCYNITPQTTKNTGEQVLDTLKNIQELLQQVLSNLSQKNVPLETIADTTPPDEGDGLPF